VSACESHLHPFDGGPPKRAFKSHQKAEAALRTIRRLGTRRDKTPARAYLCPGCHRWFLTSKAGGDG
jgi:hypothetical protein